MFYFNHISLSKKKGITKKLNNIESLDSNESIILPMVNPNSEAGEFLQNEGRSHQLSIYSGEEISILYLRNSKSGQYKTLINEITAKIDRRLPDPCILVFLGGREKPFLFSDITDTDSLQFRRKLTTIIDGCRSSQPELNLKVSMLKEKSISRSDLSDIIQIILSIIGLG